MKGTKVRVRRQNSGLDLWAEPQVRCKPVDSAPGLSIGSDRVERTIDFRNNGRGSIHVRLVILVALMFEHPDEITEALGHLLWTFQMS